MYSLLIILLPSVLGLKIINHLCVKMKNKELLFNYLLLVLFSNMVCMGLVVLLNNFDENLCLYIDEHLKFAFKYLLLLIITNTLLGFVFSVSIKNFKIKLEVKNEIKNN